MNKAFDFVSNLTPLFTELFGFPTLEIKSDYVDVKFTSQKVIRSLDYFKVPCDEFRFYPDEYSSITYVFTFYIS